jgi:acyl carrier protein
MTHDEILAGFAEVLASVAGVDRGQITPGKSFSDDLGIDSLTMVDVVVAAEDRFGLLIPDDEWSRFQTVGDVVNHLERSTGASAPRGISVRGS